MEGLLVLIRWRGVGGGGGELADVSHHHIPLVSVMFKTVVAKNTIEKMRVIKQQVPVYHQAPSHSQSSIISLSSSSLVQGERDEWGTLRLHFAKINTFVQCV